MNAESDGYIDPIYTNGGPLCPLSDYPRAREHELAVAIGNDVYEAAKPTRDEDSGESPPEIENLTMAAYYGRSASTRMNLYRVSMPAKSQRPGGVVAVAYYFRCGVCGFVLPAHIETP
jgi:hypothetical protein